MPLNKVCVHTSHRSHHCASEDRAATTSFRNVAFLWAFLLLQATHVEAANFTCSDQELVNVAEAARTRSAQFWTGKDLPGDWYAPCPILVKIATHSGGGRTSFQFTNDDVHSWQMHVEGTRTGIIEDVVPHEVDHMVRASLIRKPIVRWIDEGCATLFESEASHAKLRRIAFRCDSSLITKEWLTSKQYPADMQKLVQLYAVGFSLVEFLLERDTPSKLLRLQGESESIERALQDHYGLTLTDLQREWTLYNQVRNSNEAGCEENCPMHHALRTNQCNCLPIPANLLEVWGATWCSPCRKFKNDYLNNANFRERLNEKFHIHFHDFDQHRPLAVQRGIQGVPTFKWSGGMIEGYTTAENLLKQLHIGTTPIPAMPKSQPLVTPEAPSATTVPDISPPKRDSPKHNANVSQDTTPLQQPNIKETSKPKQTQQQISSESHEPDWSLTEFIQRILPISLTAMQWTGIIGGSAATGGALGVALTAIVFLWKRRQQRNVLKSINYEYESRADPTTAPFPRQLDEARQLLELRKSEGRVAILDALRGMFLDDELEKIKQDQPPEVGKQFDQLRATIDTRVDEVAPLSTAAR